MVDGNFLPAEPYAITNTQYLKMGMLSHDYVRNSENNETQTDQ